MAVTTQTTRATPSNVVIIGMQWGDEGKGKIVDLLCPAYDGVVRYQGGHNAGHTVKFRDRHFSLHLIPSGILHPGMLCALGNGMVIAPGDLVIGDDDGVTSVPFDHVETILAATQAKHAAEIKQMADIEAGKSDRSWVDATLAKLGCAMEH
mgnify:CR=1 FL=1